MSRGKLVVFEGPDGVGKSTLVKVFSETCSASGHANIAMSFPGREPGTLGEAVYKLHHDSGRFGLSSINPLSLQLLHVAAHIDAIETRIKPCLAEGKWVILDRFWWSTWVYGLVNGVNSRALRHLIDLEITVWGSVLPDLAVLLRRDSPFTPQPEDSIRESLTRAYADLSAAEQVKYPVEILNNEGLTPEEAAKRLALRLDTP
jgi:dTMP kinase